MTVKELAALPVGAIVLMKHDDGTTESGEIVRAGAEVWIMWPMSKLTNVIDTRSNSWESYTAWLEAE